MDKQKTEKQFIENSKTHTCKAASDEYTKGLVALKSAIDKVNKDSGETGIIVAKLKSKRWDTTKSIEFVLEQAKM